MTPRLVTIGVLVYNGGATLRRAVESSVNQSYAGCTILISDDGSTDNSAEIGEDLAARYPQVTYVRQPQNIGPPRNFRYLLQKAITPYFMWLAADDFLAPTYVESMLAELERDPGLTTCVSKVQFVRSDGQHAKLSDGTYPLQGDSVTNLATYLAAPHDNSRLYGLHRTSVLRKAFTTDDFLIAYDWMVMAATLLHGRHAEVQEILFTRDLTPDYAYMVMIRDHARSFLERRIPLLPMTYDLVFRKKIPLHLSVLKALLYINLQMHCAYAGNFHPRYAATVGRMLQRYLLWRLQPRKTPADRVAPSAAASAPKFD